MLLLLLLLHRMDGRRWRCALQEYLVELSSPVAGAARARRRPRVVDGRGNSAVRTRGARTTTAGLCEQGRKTEKHKVSKEKRNE